MVLIYIFLVISDVEHLFMYLLAICKSFLDKKIYSDSLPIFNWAVWVSLILPYMSFSFILKKESIWEMRSGSGIWKDVYNLLENKSGFTELKIHNVSKGFPGGSEVKASATNAGDPGSIPGSGRSPGEGNGNPLQYSCLENSMDRGA